MVVRSHRFTPEEIEAARLYGEQNLNALNRFLDDVDERRRTGVQGYKGQIVFARFLQDNKKSDLGFSLFGFQQMDEPDRFDFHTGNQSIDVKTCRNFHQYLLVPKSQFEGPQHQIDLYVLVQLSEKEDTGRVVGWATEEQLGKSDPNLRSFGREPAYHIHRRDLSNPDSLLRHIPDSDGNGGAGNGGSPSVPPDAPSPAGIVDSLEMNPLRPKLLSRRVLDLKDLLANPRRRQPQAGGEMPTTLKPPKPPAKSKGGKWQPGGKSRGLKVPKISRRKR